MRILGAFLALSLLVGCNCGGGPGPGDAGPDAGGTGGMGGGTGGDAGAGADGGSADAGADGGSADAGAGDAGTDAGMDAGADDAGADAGLDAGDDDAGVDAGSDGGVDAGTADAGPSCPAVGGGYTFLSINMAGCPAGEGPNVYDTQIVQTGCTAVIRNNHQVLSRLWFEGTVQLDPQGNFAPTSFQLNDAGATCSGNYDAGPPISYQLTCGSCDFGIRFGE
ncbi:MAG: hypothetical protein IAE78_12925 [Myxococcus sp.]|nr:hypothetical protein [Myxococcus sp.]